MVFMAPGNVFLKKLINNCKFWEFYGIVQNYEKRRAGSRKTTVNGGNDMTEERWCSKKAVTKIKMMMYKNEC